MPGSTIAGVVGVGVLLTIAYDIVLTTLSPSKSGPITNRLISAAWQGLLWLHRRFRCPSLLSAAGPWIAVALFSCWALFTWLGWFLVFCASSQAVVNATSHVSASLVERAYFIGKTLSTVGYGDFVPGSGLWQILSTLAAGSGFALFTLAVTYLMPVVSGIIQKRQLALSVSALGITPYAILAATADEGRYQSLETQLQQLQPAIIQIGQQHLAYPLLHYFHSSEDDSALPLALARLYEALAIVEHAAPGLPASTRAQFSSSLTAIEQFLETLGNAFITPTSEMPLTPPLNDYAALPGIKKTANEIGEHLNAYDCQRLLWAYVRKDGWEWDDVWRHAG